ncbi:MAG: 1-acyl-sn-glycerol-3-phosphate acyltransferase [Planctomycetota bacterium]|nr:MAG: 1-acyl-sn-glycerol-3-phosphate acyltransferase [Planctomycetota bacterium]
MRLYYRFLRLLAHGFYVFYFRGRVFGLRNVPQSGGVLLASNHQCFFDPVATTLALHREGNYMARDTLFLNPWFRRLIESLNAFPVRRGAADIAAVKEIMRRLRDGRIVVVFPEATRTHDGSIGQINANSLAIAKKTCIAIVPTVVDGAFEAWPRTRKFPRPGRMYVTYAPAITPQEVEAWPLEKITETVTQRLHEAMERSRRMRRNAMNFGA